MTLAVAVTGVFAVVLRDVVATDYAGYEVGVSRGAMLVAGFVALGCWVAVVFTFRSGR